ncbi:protein saal1-like [Glandiceps talaboti]
MSDEDSNDSGPKIIHGSSENTTTTVQTSSPSSSQPEAQKSAPPHCQSQSPAVADQNPSPQCSQSSSSLGAVIDQSFSPQYGHQSPSVALDRNPSPPPPTESKKLEDQLHADIIGDTVFSKHWVFTLLMKLIKEVDKGDDDGDGDDEEGDGDKETSSKSQKSGSSHGDDIEEEIENELCKLWDTSMNKDVAVFLHEWQTVDILISVIETTNAPRATEICVGILANMACHEELVLDLSKNPRLIKVVLALLECTDPPTLVETTRLIYSCVSHTQSAQYWLSAMKADISIVNTICFVLQSSTNGDLIHNMSDLVDKLLDVDDELLAMWSSSTLLLAICEAIQQVRLDRPTTLEYLLHALQLLSTTEKGAEAIVENSNKVCPLVADFLHSVCSEEVVIIIGREVEIAAAISVLDIISQSMGLHFLEKDPQIVSDTLDILDSLKVHLRRRRHSSLTEEEELQLMQKARMLQKVIMSFMSSVLQAEDSNRTVCKQLKKCGEHKVKVLKAALEKTNIQRDIIHSLEWEL